MCRCVPILLAGAAPPSACGIERTASTSIRSLSYALASISLFVILSLWIYTIRHHKHVVIKRASPVFCYGIYAGCVIITTAIYTDLTDIHVQPEISCWGTATLTGHYLYFHTNRNTAYHVDTTTYSLDINTCTNTNDWN